MKRSKIESFVMKIRITDSGCWEWTASVTKWGYAQLNSQRAHRWSYEWFIGPIPKELELDHLCHSYDLTCLGGVTCRHRRCVNPDHLEAVERRVNLMRGRGLTAINSRKTHCPAGHLLTGSNLRKSRKRACRICENAKERDRYWERKGDRIQIAV